MTKVYTVTLTVTDPDGTSQTVTQDVPLTVWPSATASVLMRDILLPLLHQVRAKWFAELYPHP